MFYIDETREIDGATFTYRCMTGRDQMELFHGLTAGEDIPADRIIRLLEKCLLDWQDAVHLRGEPLGEFHKTKVEWLPASVIDELAGAIIVMSNPTTEQKKTLSDSRSLNSTGASSPAETAPA